MENRNSHPAERSWSRAAPPDRQELGKLAADCLVDRFPKALGGVDHDTPVLAATSIEAWWQQVGEKRYPKARALFITADAGGSNSDRSHVWKFQLQRLADKLDVAIHVSRFPPGTSNWNKVEHRLFSFLSINWRGRPLRSYETIVSLIGNTTNRGGFVVRARLDRRRYPIGKNVSAKDLRSSRSKGTTFTRLQLCH